ncbi:MAG: OsmC family protein [Acidobacteriota bacterium]
MAVEITGRYTENLRVEAVHGPSGATLTTAAPVDNNGDGSSFSPTDLVATAMATCMLTVMGIKAQQRGLDLSGCTFRVEKHMRSDPRRIDRLPIVIEMPAGLSAEDRKVLERTAHTCPVHRSVLDAIDKPVEFVYPD